MKQRRGTRVVRLGTIPIGGDAPIVVQSMTNTDTRNVKATVAQINELVHVGCEVVRVAIPNREAAEALGAIKARVSIPIVADIHFDYKLALEALKQGADGLRINPGNIGGPSKVKEVVKAAQERMVPIRIGVNSGSLEKDILARHGGVTPEAMVESALRHVKILEDLGYREIKISLKAPDVKRTYEAYKIISEKVDYPLHVGITEAGTKFSGTVKSSVGLSILLWEGIGDTIRVSLTADPVDEVRVAWAILAALGLRRRGIELISCPTCGRTQVDLIPVAEEVERRLAHVATPLQVAVMGCAVNGPGEAREADVGICGGKTHWLLFTKGEVIRKLKQEEAIEVLVKEVERLAGI